MVSHLTGELLPHHFNLTVVGEPTGRRCDFCGTFPIPQTESIEETVGVTHQLALCSPDFPPVPEHRRPPGGRTTEKLTPYRRNSSGILA